MVFYFKNTMPTDRVFTDFFCIYGVYGVFFAKTFSKKIMLEKITQHGFIIQLDDDDGFTVTPADKLTQKQREFLKANKPQIMRELLLTTVYTPAGRKIVIEAKDAEHQAWLIAHNHNCSTPIDDFLIT